MNKIPKVSQNQSLFRQVALHLYRYFYTLDDIKKDREKREKIVLKVGKLLYDNTLGPRKKYHFTKKSKITTILAGELGVVLEAIPHNFSLLINEQTVVTITIGLLENTRFGEYKKEVKKNKRIIDNANKTIKYSSKKIQLRMLRKTK